MSNLPLLFEPVNELPNCTVGAPLPLGEVARRAGEGSKLAAIQTLSRRFAPSSPAGRGGAHHTARQFIHTFFQEGNGLAGAYVI